VKELDSKLYDFKGLGYSKVGHFKQVRLKIKELEDLSSKLARRHSELEAIIYNMTDGLTILDEDLNIVFVNKVQQTMFPRSSLIGEKCHKAFFRNRRTCRECPAMITLKDRQTLRGETVIRRGEYAGRCFEWATSPISCPSGQVDRIILLMRDITERKEYEFNLMRTDRMAAIGLLAAGIAHEINNPLTSIAGFSEGLLKRLKTAPELKGSKFLAYFRDYLEIINTEAYRCRDIIKNLIRFSQESSDDHETLDLNEIINDTASLIRQHAKDNGIRIRIVNRGGNSSKIIGNESELKHMFVNLFNNALDAAEEGGVLTVSTKHIGNQMQAVISNTEHEDAAELQVEALQPSQTTKPGVGGTPLSLSICYSIMQHHKGDIQILNMGEKGSAFVLRFPAVAGL